MAIWHPSHQAAKSTRDFLRHLPRLVIPGRAAVAAPPQLPMVLRVGVAGHLVVPDPAALTQAFSKIFGALCQYAESTNTAFHAALYGESAAVRPPQLRLVGQIASGVDQIAACAALDHTYALHVVLPADRDRIEKDVVANSVSSPAPDGEVAKTGGAMFRRLLAQAERVLELDHGDHNAAGAAITNNDYAQAGSVILSHCDVLLVALHSKAGTHPGGTRWMEQQAEDQNIPVIRLPIDRPEQAQLIWTDGARRESRRIFDERTSAINARVFEPALTSSLMGDAVNAASVRIGRLEARMIDQLDLDINRQFWDQRWNLTGNSALTQHALGRAALQIDSVFKEIKAWSDRHASAMAELVRGSFLLCTLLSIAAVAGALLGVVLPALQTSAEIFELLCLGTVAWFIWRSRRYRWRAQWLSHRQVERLIDQAAWLLLLGRARTFSARSTVSRFQIDEVANWTNTYFRAVMRFGAFPDALLNADYRNTVHALMSRNLVDEQVAYFEREAEFQLRSDEVLERATWWTVGIAFGMTFVYLLAHVPVWLPEPTMLKWLSASRLSSLHHALGTASPWIIFWGALLPAVAAGLSSVRSHGDYRQLAERFESAASALKVIQTQLLARFQDLRESPDAGAPSSKWLTSRILGATEVLVDEVMNWRAIFQRKNIELS